LTAPLPAKPRIEKLRAEHDVNAFDCGVPALNRYLHNFAFGNQRSGSSQTYVALIENTVVGFYTLTFGEIAYGDAPERMAKGLPRFPVPVMILARLGIHTSWQGRGLGAGLLKDAFRRFAVAADIIGGRAIIVHAKDDSAKAYYQRLDFIPLTKDSLLLYRLLKDIQRFLAG